MYLNREFNILEIYKMFEHAAKRHSCSCYIILKAVFHMDAGSFLVFADPGCQILGAPEVSGELLKV